MPEPALRLVTLVGTPGASVRMRGSRSTPLRPPAVAHGAAEEVLLAVELGVDAFDVS